MKFVEELQKRKEKIEYSALLPPKEGNMLLMDMKYRNGSDYSQEFLSTPIHKLIKTEPCGNCHEGSVWSHNGEDDYNREICEICLGEGYLYVLEQPIL